MAQELQDLAFFRQYVEQFNVLAERTNQLQLSINGFITPIPSGRTVIAALLVLASVRLFPVLCDAVLLSRWRSVLLMLMVVETAFYFFQRRRYALANGVSVQCTPSEQLVSKFRASLFALDGCMETYLSGWFNDAPVDKIRHGNLLEYLSYILCYQQFQNIAIQSKEEIRKLVQEFELKIGRKFVEGYDESLTFMGHLWEPLRILHLPLVMYLVVEVLAYATELILWCLGFTKYQLNGMSYWLRDPDCITGIRDRMQELHGEMIHSLVLMEPVNILPVWPLLLSNFVYKVPPLTSLLSFRGLILMLRALLSREVTVAETFCRRFFWHELIFWPQDIPSNCLVALSGCDDLMPSAMIRQQLQKLGKARIVYRPFAHHGDVLINLSYQAQILQAVKQLLKDLGGGVKGKRCYDSEDDIFYDPM